MRYYFDTEFIEQPNMIDLISIGIVAEDGREFYAENADVDWSKANPWVLENVKPYLLGGSTASSTDQIADEILAFASPEEKPEFWAYYGASLNSHLICTKQMVCSLNVVNVCLSMHENVGELIPM